jgi:hypothetical protein
MSTQAPAAISEKYPTQGALDSVAAPLFEFNMLAQSWLCFIIT